NLVNHGSVIRKNHIISRHRRNSTLAEDSTCFTFYNSFRCTDIVEAANSLCNIIHGISHHAIGLPSASHCTPFSFHMVPSVRCVIWWLPSELHQVISWIPPPLGGSV